MEIKVLRYFLEVAREENIIKAAKHLHVSQPTLSKQLKELEQELGKKLYVRSNYHIKLTEEGMLLRKRAEEILEMVDKTEKEFQSLEDVDSGDVHIGCAESNGIRHFITVIRSLQNTYPRIRYHFYSSGTEAVNERLDQGLLDFAIIVEEVDVSKYNYLKIPSIDQWGVIMRKDSPLAKKDVIEIKDLINLPLICSRQAMKKEMMEWFKEKFDQLHIVATYDLLFNASIMVREKLGYAIGFDGLIDTSEHSDLCFRSLHPSLQSPMYIIWKRYQVFTPVAKLLLEEMKKEFT